MNLEERKQAINEIYRVLKPNGIAFLDVRNIKDCRYKLGDNKFSLLKSYKENDEHLMHYFNRQEIKELCNIFSSCVIEDYCVTRENGKYTDCENLVFLTK